MISHLIVGQTSGVTNPDASPTTDVTNPDASPIIKQVIPDALAPAATPPITPAEAEQPAEPEIPFYKIIDTDIYRVAFMLAAVIGAEAMMIICYLTYEFLLYWFKTANL